MADEKTTQKQAPKLDEARIPLYEQIFESNGAKKKSGLGVVLDGFKLYKGKLIFAQIMFLIKH